MKNFIVVGTQRTGSSAFAEVLGLHPEVTCGWEWTLGMPIRKKIKLAELALAGEFGILSKSDQKHLARIHHSDKAWLGFRWLFSSSDKWIIHPRFSPALWMDRVDGFIKWLSLRPGIHVIHIVRTDAIDWLKSLYVAKKVKIYSKERYPDNVKVMIPKREAVRRIKAKNWVDMRLSAIEENNPFIQIHYEDFLRNPKEVAFWGLKFLNCDLEKLNLEGGNLSKQSKGKPSDYIINYHSLCETLSRHHLLNSQ